MRPDRFKCNGITGPWQLLSQQHNDARLVKAFTVGIVIPASKSKKKVVLK